MKWFPHPGKLQRGWSSPLIGALEFFAVAAFSLWLLGRGTERLGYHWQWYRVPQYLFRVEGGRFIAGPLLDGLWVTFEITSISMVLALIFGLSAALLRISQSRVSKILAYLYLESVRNTPLLVQLFFIYFVIAAVLDIGRFFAAVLALSLFEGAYLSEIFRAGILAIPRGQVEAAYSLGLSTFHTYTRIILPQAVRQMLPPLTSQSISLVKDSSLVSTVAIYDLTMQGQVVIADTFLTFEIWFTIAAIYLAVTLALSGMAVLVRLRLSGAA